jgi:hypothetical protein
MGDLIWRWRHRHINPRGLTRAQWESAEAQAAAMRRTPVVAEPWPHEALKRRRPYMPPAPTHDQIAAQLDRQLVAEANRRG